ncbi:hypothetical protein AALO_G00292470 [Alosa alosa]|uniref:Uncharacterized protein n=2 Tax=Alosa alosa TaxID=278164 RepID=A0AAV6FH54_9TELE|nr:hypothetical protein AALO_G00292470 [Alosa alosa]
MEVRGEVRGESGCFMGAMRALLNTIRNRLRPKRKRQRTKNYRICHNSAMAKIKRRKLKKQLTSGLYTKLRKPNHLVKGKPVRAFQERRKPRWVLQTREDLQPAEPASDPNTENTQAREDLNPAELASEVANIEITQPGVVLQPAELDLQADEPASWVVANAQMWREMTRQDGPVLCNMPIMHSGPGSSYPVLSDHLMEEQSSSANTGGEEQAGPGSSYPVSFDCTLDHLMGNLRSSANKEEEDQGLGLIHRQLCRRDLTGQDRVAIMYSGPFSFLVPSEWALDHLMSGEQDSRPYTMVFY